MNKLIVGCVLVTALCGSAHAALFGLIPTQASITRQALRAGLSPVQAHQIGYSANRAYGQGFLNRDGIAATIATGGDIQKGGQVTRATKWFPTR